MADETHDKLINATIATLAQDGTGGATARTIGARAGTGRARIAITQATLLALSRPTANNRTAQPKNSTFTNPTTIQIVPAYTQML